MSAVDHSTSRRKKSRHRLIRATLRSTTAVALLLVAYALAPLDRLADVSVVVSLAIGVLLLSVVVAWQLKRIVNDKHPAVRAIGALAVTAPLFLILFAAEYFVMAQASVANFNVEELTKTDALYFTVTVFSTVGFGDITAASESTRLLVTAQMILDLIVLGLGIRIFVGAVESGRQAASD
jgi:hypothetical protein